MARPYRAAGTGTAAPGHGVPGSSLPGVTVTPSRAAGGDTAPSESPNSRFASLFDAVTSNMAQVVHGKTEPIELAVMCLLAEGHLLIEDVPGVGKTSLAKALAGSIDCSWKRVQFTPDLLPTDLVGVSVLQRASEAFVFQPGPLFTNIVLADEINRASPKTQSALLEAMQERRVTVLGETHDLPRPFFVLATQNPIELEGTYPLPEAQLDRFLFKLEVTRNSVATLQRIVSQRELGTDPQVDAVMGAETLSELLE